MKASPGRITRNPLSICLGLAALGLLTPASQATTVTNTLTVTSTVVASCTVQPSTLAFGTYDPTNGSNTTGSTTVNFSCTPSTAYTVTLDAGQNSSNLANGRNMANGSNMLQYQLYTDSALTNYWGNSAGHQDTGTSSTTSLNNTLTVYGMIPKNQAVPANTYTDTVNISVIF